MALPAGVDAQLPVGILLPPQPGAAESKCGKERLQERRLGSRALETETVKHQTGGGWQRKHEGSLKSRKDLCDSGPNARMSPSAKL